MLWRLYSKPKIQPSCWKPTVANVGGWNEYKRNRSRRKSCWENSSPWIVASIIEKGNEEHWQELGFSTFLSYQLQSNNIAVHRLLHSLYFQGLSSFEIPKIKGGGQENTNTRLMERWRSKGVGKKKEREATVRGLQLQGAAVVDRSTLVV